MLILEDVTLKSTKTHVRMEERKIHGVLGAFVEDSKKLKCYLIQSRVNSKQNKIVVRHCLQITMG